MTTRISSNDPPDDVNTPQEEMDAKPTGLPTAAMRLARADRLNRQDLESAEKGCRTCYLAGEPDIPARVST
jgi:hypothetical protein